MGVKTLTIDGKPVSASDDDTILSASRSAGIRIPTLCHLEGLSSVGACRICLVEIAGHHKLEPACVTKVAEGMTVKTTSDRLTGYRRSIVELLFTEKNHVCSVCVANNDCELQNLAVELGLDHIALDPIEPQCRVDLSHDLFGHDQNRCILCTRCIRACDEVEGAHTWDVAGRGIRSEVITDMGQPWGEAKTCTSCGKCVMACPTGALFPKGESVSERSNQSALIGLLMRAREQNQWAL